ncbi:MAG: VWA domain-containing protein [Bacteroidales bacterium]|nr:VWA domain-containing protein [Bacteroidales bacterium]
MALTDYELAPAARRVLNLFFLIDTSSSMSGEKIAAVNDAIRNVIPIVDDISSNNPDAEIKIAAMTFSSTTQWLTAGPIEASHYSWTDQSANGFTAMGAACNELNSKLSHKTGFLNNSAGSYAPVIIILSDGAPTDDFRTALTNLEQNQWFRHSTRIAIAIGNDADTSVLALFTGNSELVIRVGNIDALKTIIKVAVVTSSMISSSSASIGVSGGASGAAISAPVTKAQQTANIIASEAQDIDGLAVGDEALLDALDFDDFE